MNNSSWNGEGLLAQEPCPDCGSTKHLCCSPVARHATETALDFEGEIEYLKELDRNTRPFPEMPEDEKRKGENK